MSFANPFSLEGKKILVTGASSGIGYQTCLLISQMGGTFIGVARREDELKRLLATANNANNEIRVADLTNDNDLNKLIESIPAVDGIVHSAGIAPPHTPLKFYKKEEMDRTRAINYDSAVLLLSKTLREKKIKKEASIVLVASIAGLFGTKGVGIYAGTKGALLASMRAWAVELAKSKIRVNAVAPGMVKTDMQGDMITELSAEVVAEDEKKYPLGYGETGDVAAGIVFLLSNASKWITGETLVMDGGLTSTT
jgi:NAD(P)-dependent dehydrogenase (short-subunit alcohol dehydrogenase family)